MKEPIRKVVLNYFFDSIHSPEINCYTPCFVFCPDFMLRIPPSISDYLQLLLV
jgi:hypothetical protein